LANRPSRRNPMILSLTAFIQTLVFSRTDRLRRARRGAPSMVMDSCQPQGFRFVRIRRFGVC
ncbi:MAG TPA: hypothetical protein VNS33_13855, partial [Bradyrhizobium sp.]|nr:hypothetical protein [Bradyrhizobium sp.]